MPRDSGNALTKAKPFVSPFAFGAACVFKALLADQDLRKRARRIAHKHCGRQREGVLRNACETYKRAPSDAYLRLLIDAMARLERAAPELALLANGALPCENHLSNRQRTLTRLRSPREAPKT